MTCQKVNYVFPYAYNFMIRHKDIHKITSANVQMGKFRHEPILFCLLKPATLSVSFFTAGNSGSI